jgi:RHS repeat-associated protein
MDTIRTNFLNHSLFRFRYYCSIFIVVVFCGSVAGQPANNYTKGTMVHAPNAGALGKYGDYPVSYATGVPNISVPIHTLTEGPLSLPVSINYHASGIKLRENASWVGQGWSLFAGGTITRTVQGIADEVVGGYYNNGHLLPSNLDVSDCGTPQDPYTDFELLRDAANGLKDTEADIFSFNVGGISGKFFIDYFAATSQGKPAYQFIPKQDLKLEFPSDFSSFTIIASDGTRYIFGKLVRNGVTVLAYDRTKAASSPEDQRFTTSWHLLRIESEDQKNRIELNYDAEFLSYWNPSHCSFYNNTYFESIGYPQGNTYPTGLVCPPAGPGPGFNGSILEVNGSKITSITTSTETIDFISSTANRQDIDGAGPKSLNAIEVKSSNNTFCKKFVFTYDYFSDPSGTSSFYKRLKLNQIQEYSCDNTVSVQPYIFTYEGNFIRHRFSKAVDHWGYDNGVVSNDNNPVNCPSTTVNVTSTYGASNRESAEIHMKKGMLTEIKYPTGGKTSFIYEANTAYINNVTSSIERLNLLSCTQTITQCCGAQSQNSANLSFGSQELMMSGSIQNTTFKIYLSRTPPISSCSNSTNVTARVRAYRTSDNLPVGSWIQFNIPTSVQSDSSGVFNLNQLAGGSIPFDPGVNYYFRIESTDGYARLVIKSSSVNSESKVVGGLRIKEIRSSDGISPVNDVVKTYEYTVEGSSNSSGMLYAKPAYGIAIGVLMSSSIGVNCPNGCSGSYNAILFSGESMTELSNVNGAHIYYSRVKENFTNNGYKVYNFFTPSSTRVGATYPHTPDISDIVSGNEQKSEVFNNSNQKIGSKDSFVYPENQSTSAGNMYKFVAISATSGCYNPNLTGFIIKKYGFTTKAYRLDYITEMQDGVTTTTDYSYDQTDRFLAPTAIDITNSDGKITRTENTYIHDYLTDYASAACIRTQLLTRNNISTPYKVITRTGTSGNLVQTGGMRTEYAAFDDNGQNPNTTTCSGTFHARPYRFHKYEMTWNSGTPTAGVWDLQGTIQSYNAQGKPTNFLTNNWTDAETYTWTTNGLISAKTFKDQTVSYTYYPGTRLLLGITDIDGRKSAFTYDKLMRLSKSTQDGANFSVSGNTAAVTDGNVKTEYTYSYYTGATAINHINTKTTYTTVTNSSLNVVETRQYMDGLGRPLQTVKKSWSPSLQDVVTDAVEYDNQGRVIKQFTPFTGGSGTLAFTAIPSGQKFTQVGYEASPLNRTVSVLPPDWYATTTSYGTNVANEVAYFDGTATVFYPANSLIKTVVTTPQTATLNQETITFKDKKGRMLLSRKKQGTNEANTNYVYDDKDRLIRVYPPGITNLSSQDLFYAYTYDESDRMTTKRIPDGGSYRMRYNLKDQLVYMQDNRMITGFTSDGVTISSTSWLRTQYDAYGRVEKTGMNYNLGTTPDPNNVPVNWSEIHTETQYGNTAGINMGKVTQAKTFILGTSPIITRNMTYDNITGRMLTNNGNNHLNNGTGSDDYTYTYDYAGNLLTETRVHKTSTAATPMTLTTRKTYDHSGRNTGLWHKINTNTEVKLGTYTYDFRDRMTTKGMGWHTAGVSAPIQQLDYAYNEQNWMTAINAPTTFPGTQAALVACATNPAMLNSTEDAFGTATTANDLFKLNLYYDNPTAFANLAAPQLQRNGNISQVISQVRGRERQVYNVEYDWLNRMTTATYLDVNSANTATSGRYNESVTYNDLRGNISGIQRNGLFKATLAATCFNAGAIDNLSFTYATNTNRVNTITDAAGTAGSEQRKAGFNPGAGTGSYSYDNNGNMTNDPYKAMTIQYNHLNLPTRFDFGSGKTINVLYDRAGQKLRKTVKQTATTTTYVQDYVGGLEYRTTGTGALTLEAIYHAEGRITPKTSGTPPWNYEYAIKDHLGSTRLTFCDFNANGVVDVTGIASTTEILNENHYYPFGMNQTYDWTNNTATTTSIDNKKQYNGKEWNDDFALNWLDFGKRWYDPAIARFPNPDPIIEDFPYLTSYNYASHNPITNIDLWGLQGTPAYLSTMPMDYIVNPIGYAMQQAVDWFESTFSLQSTTIVKTAESTSQINNTTTVTSGTEVKIVTETKTNLGSPMAASGSCKCPVKSNVTQTTITATNSRYTTTSVQNKKGKMSSTVTTDTNTGSTTSKGEVETTRKGIKIKGSGSVSDNGTITTTGSVGTSGKKSASVEVSNSSSPNSGNATTVGGKVETQTSPNTTISTSGAVKVKY